jgi:ABC-type amino acid transport substrate-binding protein
LVANAIGARAGDDDRIEVIVVEWQGLLPFFQ